MTSDDDRDKSYFSTLVLTYMENINTTDFKANLVVLFVAIMMGPILAGRDKYPSFLPLPLIMAPFLIAFLSLLLCVLPRYPRNGAGKMILSRNPTREDFAIAEVAVSALKARCAALAQILYWKTLFLLLAVYIVLAAMVFISLLFVSSFV